MQHIRHAERRETLAYWPAQEEQTGETVGLVTNLSEEGINIHSQHAFEHGQRLNLRVAIDPNLSGLHFLHLHAENAWCQPSAMPGYFQAGFKLVNLSPDMREGILKLITAYSFPAPHSA